MYRNPKPPFNPKPPSLFDDWSLGDRLATVLIFLVGVACIVGSFYIMQDDYRVINGFATTMGRLTSKPQATRMGGRRTRHTEYIVTYAFTIDDRSYEGRDYLKEFPVANTITVYYNRNDPTENKAQLPETWIGWGLLGFGLLFTMGAVAEIAKSWWKWKRLAEKNSGLK